MYVCTSIHPLLKILSIATAAAALPHSVSQPTLGCLQRSKATSCSNEWDSRIPGTLEFTGEKI